jgi:N-methylhydantoinase B/oxoprolinase/acetone carboxylase alpha subunit
VEIKMKRNNGKFVVSHEIDTAIKSLKNSWSVAEVVQTLTSQGGFVNPQRTVLNGLPVHDVVELFTEGYTLEKKTGLDLLTQNQATDYGVERLVGLYKTVENAKTMSYSDGVKDGIKSALSDLNIYIEGINK